METNLNRNGPPTLNQLFLIVALCFLTVAQGDEIRVLLQRAPATFDPRRAMEANSQKIGELLFLGMTLIDSDLKVTPGLADQWTPSKDGKTWAFQIKKGLKDSLGGEITPALIAECLENYRAGSPPSPQKDSFSSWVGTSSDEHFVRFLLRAPDPFLPRNSTLLRYFRQLGKKPCASPDPALPMAFSGEYALAGDWGLDPSNQIEFLLSSRTDGLSSLRFRVARDESVQVMELLRGSVDASLNSASLSKTDYLKKKKDRFKVLERGGVPVSYLGFNCRDPKLKDAVVRRAIAAAIDRDSIIQHKMFGFGERAGSFLHPMLPESHPFETRFDLKESERLLDEAGLKKDGNGIRLSLLYLTTPVRDGYETALILKDQLARVGVELRIQVVEQGIFFDQLTKGRYQLYSSRFVGISDSSIFRTILRSDAARNRVGYSNPRMDLLLDEAEHTLDPKLRDEKMKEIQGLLSADLPYFPLWFWKNALILTKDVKPIDPSLLSLSGSFRPLGRLKK